jgi:hypothetical protein
LLTIIGSRKSAAAEHSTGQRPAHYRKKHVDAVPAAPVHGRRRLSVNAMERRCTMCAGGRPRSRSPRMPRQIHAFLHAVPSPGLQPLESGRSPEEMRGGSVAGWRRPDSEGGCRPPLSARENEAAGNGAMRRMRVGHVCPVACPVMLLFSVRSVNGCVGLGAAMHSNARRHVSWCLPIRRRRCVSLCLRRCIYLRFFFGCSF